MKEIVIVRSYLYRKGTGVNLEGLRRDDREATNKWGKCKILWWFDAPDLDADLNTMTMRNQKGEDIMLYDAIRFQFEPLPNIAADHFNVSCLYSEWDFEGNAVFAPFLAHFVAITKAGAGDDEWFGGYDFYGLFEVDTEEFRDEDGGLDQIQVYAEFLGELDMDIMEVTEVSKKEQQKLLDWIATTGNREDLPHYFSG